MSQATVEFEMRNTKFAAITSVPTPLMVATDPLYGSAICMAVVKSGATTSTENEDIGKYALGCLLIDQRDGSIWVNKAVISLAAEFGVVVST